MAHDDGAMVNLIMKSFPFISMLIIGVRYYERSDWVFLLGFLLNSFLFVFLSSGLLFDLSTPEAIKTGFSKIYTIGSCFSN